MRALEGETLALVGERRWALFPWMPGGTVQRGSLSAAQVRALGAMHGRTQALLATHPDSAGATMIMRWDKQQSLGLLARLVTVATEKGIPDWIIDGIALQRRLLEAADVWTPDRYAALPCQLLHGDFHDQQVLFAGDTVTAVVDWEIWHADPRAWELVRSLAFSLLLLPPRLEDYLAGYREHVRLSEDEVRLALRLWFQSRLVGLWAWWAYLMDDNKRVEAFFPEMIAELSRVTDERWTDAVGTRFVRAACQ
jgi:homoserine kinase type II